MALTPNKFVPEQIKTNIVKVFSNENDNMMGVVINPYTKEETEFKSTFQMLRIIEHRLDAIQYPQANSEWRSFTDGNGDSIAIEYEPTERKEKVIATFNIKVLFRQNSSWQGSIKWVDKNSMSQFRSVFELLILMNSVLV